MTGADALARGVAAQARALASGHPGYVSGSYYWIDGSLSANNACPGNSIRMQPFLLGRAATVAELFAKVTTVSAGGNFQLAIYAMDPVTRRPTGAPVAKTGSLSTAALGNVSGAIVGGSVTLAPGWYWMAINTDNATAVFLTRGGATAYAAAVVGSTTLANLGGTTMPRIVYSYAQTFGTWPDLTGATIAEASSASGISDAAIGFKAG